MLSNVVGNVAPNQTREIIKEIKLSKVCDEEDSPDFPIFLEVKTIDNLIVILRISLVAVRILLALCVIKTVP